MPAVELIRHADLEIEILAAPESTGFPVRITLDGEREFPPGRLDASIVDWLPGVSPREDGEALFNLLFGDSELRRAWDKARGESPRQRVRLRIDEGAPKLHAVPWELLRDAVPGEPPLAASSDTPFSRYLTNERRHGRPVLERPVRMLVAIANPGDLEAKGLAPIDAAAERRSLEEAVAGAGDLEVCFLEPPVTLARLEAELRRGYHVLHLIAHGRFSASSGRAALFLAGRDDQVCLVRDDELARMLARQGESLPLRLVFLASCESATRSPADAFRGLAPQLIRAGVPAVVAMQDRVPIETAQAFASGFYRRLLDHGQVDRAANEARSAILSGELPGAAIPVLFQRLKSGRLFAPGTVERPGSEIYLSYTGHDEEPAAEVKAWLEQMGYRPSFHGFDDADETPRDRERMLEQRLRSCRAVVALASERSLSAPWWLNEIARARSLGKDIFLIRNGPCDVSPVLAGRRAVDLVEDRERAFRQLSQELRQAGIGDGISHTWDRSRPPYPGLLAFQEEDEDIFFGREAEIGAGLDLLRQMRRYGGAGLLLLLGASGSGKSSVMRAGLVPKLRRDRSRWLVVDPLTPRGEPLANLAAVLAEALRSRGRESDWKEIRDRLTKEPESALLDVVRDLRLSSGRPDATVLLPIDQLEELLGRPPDHPASRLLELLRATLERPEAPLIALATLRSDFLAAFQKTPAARALEFRSLPVGAMTVEGLVEAIERPAALAGIELEPGLVEALLADAETEDALPLLAFTLHQLYQHHAGDGIVEVAEYRDQMGGLQGSVARVAEELLPSQSLASGDEEALRRAFLAMVRLGEDGQFARRPVGWDELPEQVHPLLEKLVRGRLLISRDDGVGRRTLEVAHEALFRSWDKLVTWLDESREDLQLRREIGQAADQWQRAGRADEDLWKGRRLSRALELRDAARLRLRQEALTFLERAERTERRRRRYLLGAYLAVVFVLLAVLLFTLENLRKVRSANERARAEQARAVAEGTRIDNLAVSLRTSLELNPAPVSVGSDEANRRMRLLFQGLEASPRLIAVLPTTATEANGEERAEDTLSLAFSPDGRTLVAGTSRTLQIWARDGEKFHRWSRFSGGAVSVAVSSQGRWLAAAVRKGLRLLDYANGGQPASWTDAVQVRLHRLSFDPTGRILLAGGYEGEVRRWDAETGVELTASPCRQEGPIHAVRYSPDGRIIASAGDDGTVRLWRLSQDRCDPPLAGHTDQVLDLTFSPDGDLLASASLDGGVLLWDPATGRRLGEPLDSLIGSLSSVAFSPDGRRLLVGGADGRVAVWDPRRRRLLALPFTGSAIFSRRLAISRDGLLASATGSGVVLWDIRSGPRLGQVEALPRPAHGPVGIDFTDQPVAVSRDGRLRAKGLPDGSVRLEDEEHRESIGEPLPGEAAKVLSLAFSPAEDLLAGGYSNGTIRIWNIRTGERIRSLFEGQKWVSQLAFSPDGRVLASTSYDRAIRLWTPESSVSFSGPLRGHRDTIVGLAFAPDGKTLTSVGARGTVIHWDVDVRSVRRRACRIVERVLAKEQRDRLCPPT